MKIVLLVEFILIFILLPITFLIGLLPKYMIIPSLWMVCIYAYFILKVYNQRIFFDIAELKEFTYILKRFFVVGSIIIIFTFLFYPEKLFELIINKPNAYLAIIIFYPLFSVIPQELVFRKFFFYRYKIDISILTYISLNAFIFGFVHCAFSNLIAIVFTAFGGLLFASTYQKTNSLTLVTLEHTMYGILIFTIGLGDFFHHNNNI